MRICYYARNQTLASDIQAHTNAYNRIADGQHAYKRIQRLHNYVGRMEEYYQSITRTVYDTPCIQSAKKEEIETTNVECDGSSSPNQMISNVTIVGQRHAELLFILRSMNAAKKNVSQKQNCAMYIVNYGLSFTYCKYSKKYANFHHIYEISVRMKYKIFGIMGRICSLFAYTQRHKTLWIVNMYFFRGCAGFNELIVRLCIRFSIWFGLQLLRFR